MADEERRAGGAPGGGPPVSELIRAIDRADADAFGRLLAGGGDVDARADSGWTPLERAIHAGSAPFVKRLIEAGCDVNLVAKRADAASPLESAVTRRRADLVRLLLTAGARPVPARPRSQHPLAIAAGNGDAESVGLLLAAGADPEGGAGAGGAVTPLMAAARATCPEAVKLLLGAGAAVTPADRDGFTALTHAVAGSLYAEVTVTRITSKEDLKKAWALPPEPGEEQLAAHEAKALDVMRQLIGRGADVNHPDVRGRPPLFHATRERVARLLADAGAETDVRDGDKRDVYDWLAATGIPPGAVGLVDRKAPPGRAVKRARKPPGKRRGR